ncbi:MAG: 4Fe-4S dicluster domain-containing protein [Nitrospirae bacterium]|nr:4Fe-4S dicluster domain-containing protein [Nitrospirota bacterium]
MNGHKLYDRLCKNTHQIESYQIVSCFNDQIEGEDIFVSPTLMVNIQHSILPDRVIDQLIEAEQKRFDNVQVKGFNYKIEPDVIIVSKDRECINDFLSTYAGVLNITPILLEKAFSKDIYSGELVSIEGNLNNYRLSVLMPYPVDFTKCSHCGNCVMCCPEKCIDESLTFKMYKCSYCGECEKNCPEEAVDIHRYNEVNLQAPQIVIDENIKIDMPHDRRGIHGFNDYKDLFKNIGQYRVNEYIIHVSEVCQYHVGFDRGCKRCLNVCTTGAIKKDKDSLVVDHFLCSDCGACVAVCPTGAMQYAPFSDKLFMDYLNGIDIQGLQIVFANEETLKRFHWHNIGKRFNRTLFIEHPNPAALNIMQLMYLFNRGVKKVLLQKTENNLKYEHQFINNIIRQLFEKDVFIDIFDLENLDNPSEESGLIEVDSNHRPEYRFRGYTFSVILKDLFEKSKKDVLTIEDPQERFCLIDCIGEKCSLCLACVNVCKVGAIKAVEEDFSLRIKPSECINCGLCADLCPEKALTIKIIGDINESFFEEKLLAHDEPLRCKRCGKVFGNKKVYDEVIRRLISVGLFEEKGKFLHLCEDCRVIAMIEGGFEGDNNV